MAIGPETALGMASQSWGQYNASHSAGANDEDEDDDEEFVLPNRSEVVRCALRCRAMSAVGEGRNVTLWGALKRQKHGLGNIALAASTLLLALRLVDQDKELERLRRGESSLLDALRRENQSSHDRLASFRAAVEAEVERVGARLPPLSTRIRNLLEQSKVEEPRPVVSREETKGQEAEVLQSQGKGKTSFMV